MSWGCVKMLRANRNLGYVLKRPELTVIQYNFYRIDRPLSLRNSCPKCWTYLWHDADIEFDSQPTGRIKVSPFQIILCPPEIKYALFCDSGSYHELYIDFTLHEKFAAGFSKCFLLPALSVRKLTDSFDLQKSNERLFALRVYGLIYEALNKIPDHEINRDVEKDFSSPVIRHLVEDININVGFPRRSNSFYAADAKMSTRHFLRKFKEETGFTPQHYSLRQRIERAKTYLSVVSNLSINEIAMHTGFSDRYSFSKAFKKMTGISPAAYRKSIKP